jgi:hypothetical protein
MAHRQVGTHDEVVVFERDLVELAARLGRPRPEVRGYRLFEEGTCELGVPYRLLGSQEGGSAYVRGVHLRGDRAHLG